MTNKEKTINSLAWMISKYVENEKDDKSMIRMLRNLADAIEEDIIELNKLNK